MKKNSMKKGFTLIELLAVIIILAIIALIATPIILNVIDDAKKSAGLSEANMIYSGIENYCSVEEMKEQMDSSYVRICNNQMTAEEVSKMVNLGNANILEIGYNGNKLTSLKVESNNHEYTLCWNDKFVMDDEECPKLSVSFAEDSWETIAKVVKLGKASEVYNVGDTKEVTVEGYTNGDEQTFTVRIANISTPEECNSEGFSQTACGFVLEFADIITTYQMDDMKYRYWPDTELYSFVNDTIYNALPSDLKNVIIDTYTLSHYYYNDYNEVTYETTSIDKLYLLSPKEVWGDYDLFSDYTATLTRQLDYYKNNGVTEDNYSGAIKTYQGSADDWWLRAHYESGCNRGFFTVMSDGDYNYVYPYGFNMLGVAPAFRIG